MMETLRGWLLGLTAAALAVSLLTAMLPKGETIRRIAGLAGGLILLLAVVQPLLRVRWEELTWRYETYQREMDRQTEAYQAAYADSLSGDIADRTAAYIYRKKRRRWASTAGCRWRFARRMACPCPMGRRWTWKGIRCCRTTWRRSWVSRPPARAGSRRSEGWTGKS